jgi:beta-galactosidase/beta-glucuronidase
MDFPDMKSLESAAECWKFRKPNKGETEQQYRTALADFVQPKDFVESCEIRNKVGWDRFSPDQGKDMLHRTGFGV